MKTITRRQFINTAAAAMPVAVAGGQVLAAEKSARRPNVVFVFADQMRAHAMGCMGNTQVITPRLDKLAGEGLLVTNGISAQPVCTPYRAQLLTGRYGHTTGVIHKRHSPARQGNRYPCTDEETGLLRRAISANGI